MKVKSPKTKISLPEALLPYLKINHLKELYRQGWIRKNVPKEKCESVADHSFGVLFLTWSLSQQFPELDKNKILKLAFVHDLGEHYTGDITFHDNVKDKEDKEKEGIKKLKDPELSKLFEEYIKQQTPESIFVMDMDLLEMAIQAKIYESKYNVDLSEFYETVSKGLKNDKIKQIFNEMIE